jgi:hypothetical protein
MHGTPRISPLLSLSRLAVVLLPLVVSACDNSGVAAELSRTYGDCSLERQDHGAIEVLFTDSPFAERSDETRRTTARKVAEYVRDHYPKYKGATGVTVAFQSKKEAAKDGKHAAATYTFTRADLGDGPPAPEVQDTSAGVGTTSADSAAADSARRDSAG